MHLTTVAYPGIIVSTIADEVQAETVTFRRDRSHHQGFTTEVQHDEPSTAEAMHALAVVDAQSVSIEP